MIKINTGIFDMAQIKQVYLEERYQTTPSSNSKISLIVKIKNKIESTLRIADPQGAEKIEVLFLREHFVTGNDAVSEDKILSYLLNRNIEEIILSFWRCVSRVWTEKLHEQDASVMVTEEYAEKLSRWAGVKRCAVKEGNITRRRAMIWEIVTKETLPLFVNIEERDIISNAIRGTVITNKEKLKKVNFKYSDMLFDEKGSIRLLKNVFQYDWLNDAPRHTLITAMHIPVCPYCNRQYITSYLDANKEKTTADLDHFYIKSQYPFLALSLYNFVPSCQICNSRFKGTTDFYSNPHVYPYRQGFGSKALFKIADPNLLMDETAWNRPDVVTLAYKNEDEDIRNSVETFCLQDIYQSHKDYVHEIVWKAKIYGEDQIKELLKSFPEIFENADDVKELVFGQYLDLKDAYKRPLAKLTQDILKDVYDLD